MKPIQICSRLRGCVVPLIALASVCWLLPGAAVTQQQPIKKELPIESRPAPATEMRVFQAKYVRARDMARTIQEISGKPPQVVRVSVDEASNSVIVAASREDMASIEALIVKIDDAQSRSGRTFRFFPLRLTRVDGGLEQALQLLLPKGSYALDPERNLVLVSGDARDLDAVARVLERLDRPQDKPIVHEMQIRIAWLASGLARKESGKPPEDLKGVLAELAKMGVEEPRLVTQTLITVLPGTPFRVEGLAGLDQPYRLSVSGMILGGEPVAGGRPGEANRLQISIHATQATVTPPTPANEIGLLQTEITAPPGHSVVLGMTPTATITSVFVVQILPKK